MNFVMETPNIFVFISGRFVIGIISGVRIVAISRFAEEYSPSWFYGPIATILYFVILLGANIAGAIPFNLVIQSQSNFNYRYIFVGPGLVNLLIIILSVLKFKLDTPKFYVCRNLKP
jgi:MFS family permease